ncbi:MAG: hypothetical protein ABIV25_16015 [Paracoccaceae bacterium]
MKVQDQVKRLLDETPDLRLVAFGDLSSGLILNWSAKSACPREVLDLLGEKAAACFALLNSDALPPEADPTKFGTSVIQFSEQGSSIFVRQSASSDDVICAVCEAGAGLGTLMHSATLLADMIAGAE